jgi:predicted transposase/invertase (TIGR01784 family)
LEYSKKTIIFAAENFITMKKEEINKIGEENKLKDRYIDPFTDFGFKKLFGEECNKDLVLSFLNELLYEEEGRIVSITYRNTEKLGTSKESRKAVFDIYCENEHGERFIIELQRSKQAYFKERTLYYGTFPVTDQAIPGDEWNYNLKPVYIVAILNFVMEEHKNNPNKFRYDVMLTDQETKEVFYNKLKYIYLEMPKFKKTEDELETNFEKWLWTLKHLKRLYEIPERLQIPIFKRIFAAAEIAQLSPTEYQEYIDSLNSLRDYNNVLDYAKAEAKAEGEAIGIEKGKTEEKIEIAKNLKNIVIPIEQIAKATNLSTIEIENLI